MMTRIIRYSVLFTSLGLFACSSGTEEQKQDHVFKGYESALEKAKQVQPQLEEAEEKRQKQLEDMMR